MEEFMFCPPRTAHRRLSTSSKGNHGHPRILKKSTQYPNENWIVDED